MIRSHGSIKQGSPAAAKTWSQKNWIGRRPQIICDIAEFVQEFSKKVETNARRRVKTVVSFGRLGFTCSDVLAQHADYLPVHFPRKENLAARKENLVLEILANTC